MPPTSGKMPIFRANITCTLCCSIGATQFDAPGDGEPDRLGYLNVNTYRLPWLDFKGKGLCRSRHVRINEVKNAFLLLLESVVRF